MNVLLLDVDGVLVHPPAMFSHYLKRTYNPDPWTLTMCYRYAFRHCLLGQADIRRVLPLFLKLWRYPGTVREFLHEWFEFENHPDLALVEYVHQLQDQGWSIYLATNQEKQRTDYLLHQMRFGEFSVGEFSSATIGAQKPDPTYFTRVSQLLGIAPQQIIFWDDSKANVQAAEQAGWTAYRYESLDGFCSIMSQHNLASDSS